MNNIDIIIRDLIEKLEGKRQPLDINKAFSKYREFVAEEMSKGVGLGDYLEYIGRQPQFGLMVYNRFVEHVRTMPHYNDDPLLRELVLDGLMNCYNNAAKTLMKSKDLLEELVKYNETL